MTVGFGLQPFGTSPFGGTEAASPIIAPTTGWRYLAQRIDGSGVPGQWIDTDLPLTGVSITDVLSGPPVIRGRIDPAYRELMADDGRPVLDEWGTVIYAEADGQIRGAAIYTSGDFDGPVWSLDCAGFGAYPKGMSYLGEASFVGVDPLDVVRHLWSALQSGQASNLGMVLDASTAAGTSVGTAEEPFVLNHWSIHDIGGVIDDLARSTPFDYREIHRWNQRRDEVQHELVFGAPRLGERRRGLRFVLGENVHAMPRATRDGSDYANHVRFIGAGEGRDMVQAEAMIDDGRLRRMAVVEDKSVHAVEHAHLRAAAELNRRLPLLNVANVTVRHTVNTPLGSFGPGDEIRLQGDLDWFRDLDLWMRVVSVTITPDHPEVMGVSLVRSGL